ncbi:MAG: protein BatD, partial [Bacteroidota bacterium]
DKLNIPSAEISHENIRLQMEKKNILNETIDAFIKTLSECEFVKYAPGAVTDNLEKTFEETVTLITHIEEQCKA